MRDKEKIIVRISGVLIVIGLVGLFGTIGAADANIIEFETLVRRLIIHIALMSAGLIMGQFGGWSYV